jgi:beta-glucosidase
MVRTRDWGHWGRLSVRSIKSFAALAILLTSFAAPAYATEQYPHPFQNPSLSVEARIDNVLSLMTRQEKMDFLGKSLNLPRLGIHGSADVASPPGSNGQLEGLHGVALGGPGNWGKKSPGAPGEHGGVSSIATTQFPQASGLGATWDPALLQQVAAEEGYEARYIFQRYDRGGLILRAPNADLARDPRWGRSEESFGEDPYFVGRMSTAFVKGLQGDRPKHWLTASLLKHFMANSNEDDRSGSSSNFDPRLLHEYYSFPFRMAIEQGGSHAYMASYNAVNGIPMTASPLLQELTVKLWGFDGMIDTDRTAVTYMVTRHKYFPDMEAAVAGAMHAGINQFLDEYAEPLGAALQKNLLTEAELDRSLRGVFRVLIHLGVLDPPARVPYTRIGKDAEQSPWDCAATGELALRATRESIVLLKNLPSGDSPPLLPLDAAKLKSIAVVGPRADEVDSDFYGGTPPFAITPLQGIKQRAGGNVDVRYSAAGDAAVQMARTADIAIVLIGNHPTCGAAFGHCPNPTEGKEAVDRKLIDLDPEQQRLVQDVYAANPRTAVVLISGFPYAVGWAEEHVPALVHMAHSSEQEGRALAEVLFGDYNPAGRLSVTWPQSLDQVPPMMDYDIHKGRTYMYFKGQPLYAFGYGLSYTTFEYSGLRVSSEKLPASDAVTVSIKVANTGKRAGDEVVQLYVQHLDSKVDRPREELKGFERVALRAGEVRNVRFRLEARDLAYWDVQRQAWTIEHDRVRVMIGSSSSDIKAQKVVAVTQ